MEGRQGSERTAQRRSLSRSQIGRYQNFASAPAGNLPIEKAANEARVEAAKISRALPRGAAPGEQRESIAKDP